MELQGMCMERIERTTTVVWFFILALTVHSFMGIKKYNDEYFERCQ